MNIFLTGGTGQVGFELQRELSPLGRVMAPTRQELDLTDIAGVNDWLLHHRPDAIVNAAAWTAVDAAEAQGDQAYHLNAELPAQLASYARAQNILLVHYSSDYVYSGKGEAPWQEDGPTGPLSLYGVSKLAGDKAVLASGAHHLILRTSWIYSTRGNNFMKTMLRLGRERDSLAVVADQIGAPTPAHLIAELTALALAKYREGALSDGLYHLAPRGETSWYGFAQKIFQLAREQGVPLAISSERIEAISTEEYPAPARRPHNSRLNLERLEKALDIELPRWQPQLELTLKALLKS
ncbi:dTDP-4-dehydrorhamnose reductase [Halomonas sp. PR-M31]|uniref:dTDP-4-dehydrorhamnose reductase n=1 Tax=Halomonas sp. PR-M31 TaxID=1471202 RepID=UPI000651C7BD|nr:dTDP-4-dehydrorhamnose reductase [Halomonas sp. PR-M31]